MREVVNHKMRAGMNTAQIVVGREVMTAVVHRRDAISLCGRQMHVLQVVEHIAKRRRDTGIRHHRPFIIHLMVDIPQPEQNGKHHEGLANNVRLTYNIICYLPLFLCHNFFLLKRRCKVTKKLAFYILFV